MTDEEKRDDAAEEPQEEKKSDSDWITAQVPKVSRQPKPAGTPKGAASDPPVETMPVGETLKDDIESTIVEGADSPAATMPAAGSMGAGASAPAVSAPAATGGSSVPLGGVLENIGVSDERTQKIIVYGCGALIALSCACSCIAAVLTMMSGGGLEAFF